MFYRSILLLLFVVTTFSYQLVGGKRYESLNKCDDYCGQAPEPAGNRGTGGEMRVPAPPTYEPSYKPNFRSEHRVPAPVAPPSYEPVYEYGRRKKREANSTENDDYYEDESYYSSNEDSDYGADISDDDTRIVNGYDSDKRPWLALLLINGGSCGGSLINHKFILTAAHCFCRAGDGAGNKGLPCDSVLIQGKNTSLPVYSLKENVQIFLGVNDYDTASIKGIPELQHHAISVKIAPGWNYHNNILTPDLAIVELSQRVEFISNMISPICVPSTPRFNDRPRHAYVAGWGAAQFSCDTDDFGPSPHSMCNFPFLHKGEMHNKCSHTPTPGADNPICAQFYAWAKNKRKWRDMVGHDMAESQSFKLYYWNEQHRKPSYTTCYSSSPGQHGWCGTCDNDLKYEKDMGKRGYCDKFESGGGTPDRPESEMTRPTFKKDWGWCRGTCDERPSLSNVLQETKLDLLTPDECSYFEKMLAPNRTNEICTGRKNSFPKHWKFKRLLSKTKKKYHFKLIGPSTNYLGFKKTKYNFYLGGTDSCQGDSGGPLYTWTDMRKGNRASYIIGLVSRGTGCANLNSPGIFTRISKHLKWIKKITRSGDCDQM